MKVFWLLPLIVLFLGCSNSGGGNNPSEFSPFGFKMGEEPTGSFEASKESVSEPLSYCADENDFKIDPRVRAGMASTFNYLHLAKDGSILGLDELFRVSVARVDHVSQILVNNYEIEMPGQLLTLTQECNYAGEASDCKVVSQSGPPVESVSGESSEAINRYCYVRETTVDPENSWLPVKGTYTFPGGMQVEAYRTEYRAKGTVFCQSFEENAEAVDMGPGESVRIELQSYDVPNLSWKSCGGPETFFMFHEVKNEKGERLYFYRRENTSFKL